MENKVNPNLETICRLCLKENAGTIYIYPKGTNSDKYASLSIPMRIMTCAGLEVKECDGFPKKICTECRFQLEKFYYFRKQSQISDSKLRKHLRIIGMGKASKVFLNTDEDDEDEIELQDTIKFIKEEEDKQKRIEKKKIESILNELKIQNEQDLKRTKENLIAKCREELTPEIREQLRNKLKLEVENELRETLKKQISEHCLTSAKESIRNEVRKECRQLEIRSLLDDLQTYLTNKKKYLDATISKNELVLEKGTYRNKTGNSLKRESVEEFLPNIKVLQMELQLDSHNAVENNKIILTENGTEDDLNANEVECVSEGNFLMYDSDNDTFDIRQKPVEEKVEYVNSAEMVAEYEDEFIDSNSPAYEKISEENIDNHEEAVATTTTTAYHIEDNENGEIHLFKKCNEDVDNEMDDDGDQNNEHIMVIDFPESLETNYVGEIEEVKYIKAKNISTSKSKKSADKQEKISTVTRTTSTSETFLTKTYTNPMQRKTDTPKTFKCEGCPMVFSTKPSVERHARTHRKLEKNGVNFQCPECLIVVSCRSALRRHMFVHYEKKPFSCTICEKSFVQKEILKRHMQTHTGIKPHQCPHCDRSFAQRIYLTQHINRTHLEEPCIQQYNCHLCTKRFNHASGLSRHLAAHSGVAFQCSECDRTFGDRSSIKRHIVTMHTNLKTEKTEQDSKTPQS